MVEETKIKTIQLILTEQCNLNCAYCYEPVKSATTMSLALACQKIERLLMQDDEFELLMIDMFGGEPLLVFDTIVGIVDFVHSREWPKRHHFSISTNGTLLDGRKKTWLACNRGCITPMLSLDGTKRAHDHNRSNSYDRVVQHVPFFREHWPKQPVKMTIGPDTMDQVAAGIRNVHSLGLEVQANVVFENVWRTIEEKQRLVAVFEQQLTELVDYFAEHEEFEVPMMLDLPIQNVKNGPADVNGEVPSWCGAGKYMVAIDSAGREYPCQRFTPFCSNRSPLVTADQWDSFSSASACVMDSRCSSCPAVGACPSCQGHNWEVSGHPSQRTDFHCEFILLQLLATAKLRYRKLQRKIQQLSLDAGPEILAGYKRDVDGILNVMAVVPEMLSAKAAV